VILPAGTCTTFTTKKREKGKVATTIRMENTDSRREQMPGPSSQAKIVLNQSYVSFYVNIYPGALHFLVLT
jgi:hypothetical protein